LGRNTQLTNKSIYEEGNNEKEHGFLTIIFLAVTLTIPAGGAERSSPGSNVPAMQKAPKQPIQAPIAVIKSDLVITNIMALGKPYPLSSAADCSFSGCNPNDQRQVGVEFSIMNKGLVASGSFSVGVAHSPQCEQNCTGSITNLIPCNIWWTTATRSFRFSPPITVTTLLAGETRTIIGRLILPTCLSASLNGKTASVYLGIDDMNQVHESDESNNKSAPINITWQ
jgi:hypothetical protein